MTEFISTHVYSEDGKQRFFPMTSDYSTYSESSVSNAEPRVRCPLRKVA